MNIKLISIHRAEGLHHECGTRNFTSWESAQAWLSSQRNTYPIAGYDKHDVGIIWEDGFTYGFRLDCQRDSSFRLQEELRAEWEFYAGKRKPEGMSEEQYLGLLAQFPNVHNRDYNKLLATYA